MPIQSINPATGELLRSYTPLTEAAIHEKISLAHEAFLKHSQTPLSHRELCMRKLAHLLETEVADLAALITAEMGKPIVASRAEILKCATACRYYSDHAQRILTPEAVEVGANEAFVRWDPLGVILAVMPWNFPFWQVFRFLAPALMAGNVGLLKHASNVPQCALAIEELVRRSGFSRGTFQTLVIEAKQVEMVLADERVKAATVTGSEGAGRAVAAQAGWLIKKTVLELGGSDPFIVMASAPLDSAAAAAAKARCINSGQSCIAAKRFIVADSIYNTFESKFVECMRAMKIGDPMQEDTDIGPLATAAQVSDTEAQVSAAVQAGGRILTGGKRIAGNGNYFAPTVIAGLPRTAAVYREEFFGPVALLFRAGSADEAITIANDTPVGLAASVWTQSESEQKRFVQALECGAVFFNEIVASDPRLPFGGVKHSGYGRELSAAGMREFLNPKTVVIHETSATGQSEKPEPSSVQESVAPPLPVRAGIPPRSPRTRIKLKRKSSGES